ncbi:MAG: hypothetical protein [Mu-like cryoconite phage AB09]|nr:MAG: hypothetical protein [Mu-like cryoconite phage AB09]
MGKRDLEIFQIAVALFVGVVAIWYGFWGKF